MSVGESDFARKRRRDERDQLVAEAMGYDGLALFKHVGKLAEKGVGGLDADAVARKFNWSPLKAKGILLRLSALRLISWNSGTDEKGGAKGGPPPRPPMSPWPRRT